MLPLHSSLPPRPPQQAQLPPATPPTFQPQLPHSTYSSHYVQAYNRQTTWPQQQLTPTNATSYPLQYFSQPPRPGEIKCTYKNCTFAANAKSLEIHMMDRHLIYPSDWESRKPKADWDADPSLKGKPMMIQGTSISLDSPEILDAWIEERKKRWPSTTRVQEKRKQLEDAVERGQILLDDGRKKQKMNPDSDRSQSQNNRKGTRGKGRGRGAGARAQSGSSVVDRRTDTGWGGRGRGRGLRHGSTHAAITEDLSSSSGDDSDSPEVVSSKISIPATTVPSLPKPMSAPQQKQPRPLPHNQFGSRPSLLRNLLLPEIRMTVSNLSQAIRFLVDNDFLENVELKPGQADEQPIQVVSQVEKEKDDDGRKP